MNAFKNLTHAAVLALWAIAGAIFSLHALFNAADVMAPLTFWLWFAGFAAATTGVVQQLKGPIPALLTHAGALVLLNLIPRAVMPFSLLRIGYDLLLGNR